MKKIGGQMQKLKKVQFGFNPAKKEDKSKEFGLFQ